MLIISHAVLILWGHASRYQMIGRLPQAPITFCPTNTNGPFVPLFKGLEKLLVRLQKKLEYRNCVLMSTITSS